MLLFPILSSNTSNSIHMGFLKVQLKHKITQILSLWLNIYIYIYIFDT